MKVYVYNFENNEVITYDYGEIADLERFERGLDELFEFCFMMKMKQMNFYYIEINLEMF